MICWRSLSHSFESFEISPIDRYNDKHQGHYLSPYDRLESGVCSVIGLILDVSEQNIISRDNFQNIQSVKLSNNLRLLITKETSKSVDAKEGTNIL